MKYFIYLGLGSFRKKKGLRLVNGSKPKLNPKLEKLKVLLLALLSPATITGDRSLTENQKLKMPSKKKQSKTPSRLSNGESPASPRTPASSTTGRDTDSINEEELRRSIEEASAAFPSLIGKSAIIGRVADVASESIRGCKIWLSETSMVAASLSPGSIVSVN